MKKISGAATILMVFLFCATTAFAENWTAITDEVDVDFSTNIVRVYALVKNESRWDENLRNQARKTLLAYIDSLTTGKERNLLKNEFAKRPALYGKVQHLVEKNSRYEPYTPLPATKQMSQYSTFDLTLLTQLLPNLNFPSREDAL